MNIYFDNPHTIDPSVIISIIALIFSGVALYFQFFRKTKKLMLNIFFSTSPELRSNRDIVKNKISLSNSGNVSILVVQISYRTIGLNGMSTYETNVHPNTLPVLLKPSDTILYDVTSNTDLFVYAIQGLEKNSYGAFQFNIYLIFTVVVNDKSAKHQVLLQRTQYSDPHKVNHSYSGILNGVDILNEKYKVDV